MSRILQEEEHSPLTVVDELLKEQEQQQEPTLVSTGDAIRALLAHSASLGTSASRRRSCWREITSSIYRTNFISFGLATGFMNLFLIGMVLFVRSVALIVAQKLHLGFVYYSITLVILVGSLMITSQTTLFLVPTRRWLRRPILKRYRKYSVLSKAKVVHRELIWRQKTKKKTTWIFARHGHFFFCMPVWQESATYEESPRAVVTYLVRDVHDKDSNWRLYAKEMDITGREFHKNDPRTDEMVSIRILPAWPKSAILDRQYRSMEGAMMSPKDFLICFFAPFAWFFIFLYAFVVLPSGHLWLWFGLWFLLLSSIASSFCFAYFFVVRSNQQMLDGGAEEMPNYLLTPPLLQSLQDHAIDLDQFGAKCESKDSRLLLETIHQGTDTGWKNFDLTLAGINLSERHIVYETALPGVALPSVDAYKSCPDLLREPTPLAPNIASPSCSNADLFLALPPSPFRETCKNAIEQAAADLASQDSNSFVASELVGIALFRSSVVVQEILKDKGDGDGDFRNLWKQATGLGLPNIDPVNDMDPTFVPEITV